MVAAGAAPAPGGTSLKSVLRAGAAALIAGAASGCVPIIGAFTLGDLYTGTSLVATGLTGKSLTDDALGAVTGEDCSMMGAALEKDRKLCEENGAKVTQADFKGLLGAHTTSAQPPAVADAAADTPDGASAVAVDSGADTSPPQAKAVALTRASASGTN